MTLKDKIGAAAQKYGYTRTGYGFALVAFPPAAVFIVWKLSRRLVVRRLAIVPAAAIVAAAPIIGTAIVAAVVKFVATQAQI